MKLPDFGSNESFNRLRRVMRAGFVQWSSTTSWRKVDRSKLLEALETTGIDVPIEEIDIADNGTFEYQGQKVVIYIRDQITYYGKHKSGYRFHIADCSTLRNMKTQGRYGRYVVSRRTTGKFIVNVCQGNQIVEKGIECELKVCRNCLARLNYNGYARAFGPEKQDIWESFSLAEFFEVYDSTISDIPYFDEANAPANVYSDDWAQISLRHRELAGWQCEKCGLSLESSSMRRYLQVHHCNGLKHDNSPANLQALCIKCHAQMPRHKQLRYSRDYTEWQRLRCRRNL